MARWILVPCLVQLRSEFNALAPARSKRSDGAIGDVAHQKGGASDHLPDEDFAALKSKDADKVNEVHAIDVDKDLGGGRSMTDCVRTIVTRHREGKDDRLQYVIWNRTIWSASWGWTARAYTGASPHDHHAHFSAKYTSAAEASTRPFGLLAETAPAPKPPAGGPKPGSRTLRKGMSGPDVAYVRRWLGLSNIETFDQALATKVAAYQRMRGIAADSIVGRDTWRNMGVKVTY